VFPFITSPDFSISMKSFIIMPFAKEFGDVSAALRFYASQRDPSWHCNVPLPKQKDDATRCALRASGALSDISDGSSRLQGSMYYPD
jgi:hypothetical protein